MIAIPNMEMPKSCYNHCFEGFIADKDIGCPLNDYIDSHQYKHSIHPDCPLIEIDLVRCGECKHYGFKDTDRGGFPCCTNEIGATPYRMPTDFCSYGERRADGDI